jgi:hypothetical protein
MASLGFVKMIVVGCHEIDLQRLEALVFRLPGETTLRSCGQELSP